MCRKLLTVVVFLALSLVLSSCFLEFDSMANAQPPFKNLQGEDFTSSSPVSGTANGYGGQITVTLGIIEGYIVTAVISAPSETQSVAGPAVIARAVEIMINTNNVDVVDALTGSTFTAKGIRQAAVRALSENPNLILPPHLAEFQ